MKLIDKDALVAEIERRVADNKKDIERASHKNLEDYFEGYEDALVLLKEQFLDTLEVKEVDLDDYYHKFLEKEWFEKNCPRTVSEMMAFTAKHFFERGMQVSNKAQEGEEV